MRGAFKDSKGHDYRTMLRTGRGCVKNSVGALPSLEPSVGRQLLRPGTVALRRSSPTPPQRSATVPGRSNMPHSRTQKQDTANLHSVSAGDLKFRHLSFKTALESPPPASPLKSRRQDLSGSSLERHPRRAPGLNPASSHLCASTI